MTGWVTVGAEAGQLSGGGLGRHHSRAVCPGESGCYRLWVCGRSPALTDLPGSPSPEPTGGGGRDVERKTKIQCACDREREREERERERESERGCSGCKTCTLNISSRRCGMDRGWGPAAEWPVAKVMATEPRWDASVRQAGTQAMKQGPITAVSSRTHTYIEQGNTH